MRTGQNSRTRKNSHNGAINDISSFKWMTNVLYIIISLEETIIEVWSEIFSFVCRWYNFFTTWFSD